MAQQKAIDITGNNISNVNTPGYSRQRLNLSQAAPVRSDGGTLSTGVTAGRKVQRIQDQFIWAQINAETESLGRWQAQKDALSKAELMFDEVTGYGLNNAMSNFWNSWQDLVNNPSGQVERRSLLNTSEMLSMSFNKLSTDLQQVRTESDHNIKESLTDVNRLAAQIAEVNGKIANIEVNGFSANEYRDERDLLLRDLGELIDIQSFEDSDGFMTVSTGGGKPLVERSISWELTAVPNAGGMNDVMWMDSAGGTADITSRIEGGKLKGWIEARDTAIPDYLNQLDALAQGIMSDVNTLHSAGFSLDGSTTGQAFFSGTDASNMAVDAAIVADVNLIAAASTAAGAPGDDTNAIDIANLRHGLNMAANTTTYDDYYNSLVSLVGADTRDAELTKNHEESMMAHLENYREEISGVSLDEEMVNLIKFQHAYAAAAKMISTADELLSTTINMVR
ncbi:MAG: flagellar hook-associated protein FlgK [Desulfobacteraceae bacterium]|nr:flagellar hook-associated protein FlgK [Desulfobacteraceae bacterium]